MDAAIAAQRELQLPVRMGIATGEAELRDGDYFGTVLNRAARVMAAGHGGQILLAESTAGLLSGVDLSIWGRDGFGMCRCRSACSKFGRQGLGRSFRRCGRWIRRPATYGPPPRASSGGSPNSAKLQAALKEHRLVTLTGVGGVGKTRLALEVAAAWPTSFPTGSGFSSWPQSADPAAVPDAVAAVLGITQQAGKTVTEVVAAALEGRSRLLVFDNCEHVLDAAADLIEAILAHSATVKVLATSREGLGVADEQLWPVPVPGHRCGNRLSGGRVCSSNALQAVAPSFAMVNGDEAAAVVEICRRLDGIPLAIELAASRMASMTASEVRDRLDRSVPAAGRLAARPGTPPDAAPRGGLVLRPSRRHRKDTAGSLFGLRRGIRSRKVPRRHGF